MLSILVDGIQEEMMNEPDMRGILRIQSVMHLEFNEKYLPLLAKSMGKIVP